MTKSAEASAEQERWDQMGVRRLEDIRDNPAKYIIKDSPLSHRPQNDDFVKSLGDLKDKTVLDLGCGLGGMAVFLAQRGAKVTGLDIGPALIEAATMIATTNKVDCKFQVGNITELSFASDSFDLVVGTAILHHLSEPDLIKAVQEVHRVLHVGGTAVFSEPVENSRAFDFIQNLIPIKGRERYRPSILQRKAWKQHLATLDDRPVTTQELVRAGKPFKSVRVRAYGFLMRFSRFLPPKSGLRKKLKNLDNTLFRVLPPLRQFCQSALVEYHK